MPGITYSIEFAAAIARLEEGAKQGSKAIKQMADEMEGASNFARHALEALGVALSVGAFVEAVRGASEAADAAAKMGDRFGIASEQMIGMHYAARLAGSSNEGLDTALRGLAKSSIDAARGGAQAAQSYALLHINASEFVKLPMDQQLSIIIDKLAGVENVSLRNALAQKLMGKAAAENMGIVAEGSEAFKKATEDAIAWGSAVNRVDAAKLEMMNDALKRMQEATRGTFTLIALQFAPIVAALANHFADAKAEAQGYREEIQQGTEIVVTAVAYAANVIQGLRFAWAGVKLAIMEVYALELEAIAGLARMVSDSKVLEWMQYIPGPAGLAARAMKALGNAGKESLTELAESARATADSFKEEFDEIANSGLPAEKIIAKVKAVRAAMDEEAKEIAKKRKEFGKTGADVDQDKKDDHTWKQHLATRIAQLQREHLTEQQLLEENLLEKQNLVDIAAAQGLITDEQWQAQSAMVYYYFEQEKTKLLDNELKKRYNISNVYRELDFQSSAYFLTQMSAMMQSHNRAAFEIGKAAAISKAIVDTITAAQGSYAALAGIPYVGPFLGAAAAAAAIVVGVANVEKIRNTQFGAGNTSTPVFSASPVTGIPTASTAGAAATSVTPPSVASMAAATPPPQDVHITFVGGEDKNYTYDEVANEIIPLINDAVGNGVNITVSSTHS